MISVVIPTKNAGPSFSDTLEAISSQSLDEELEIVVVDSGSSDGTVTLGREYSARVIEVRPEDFNHGLTRNIGIENARGELVVLTVQDAIPADRNWLSSLAAAVRSDERVAGAYSRHISHGHANLFVKQRIQRGFLGREQRVVQSAEVVPAEGTATTDELYACYAFNNVSSMMRREVWKLYPLKAMSFAEDLDWGKRVIDAGYKIIYDPASAVFHSHQRGWREELRRSYVTQTVMNKILGGRRRHFSAGVMMRYFWRFFVYSASLLVEPEIRGFAERLKTAHYAFAVNAAWYLGMTLGNKSEKLMRQAWFDNVDKALRRGL